MIEILIAESTIDKAIVAALSALIIGGLWEIIEKIQHKTMKPKLDKIENKAVLMANGIWDNKNKKFVAYSKSPWYVFSPVDVSGAAVAYVRVKISSLAKEINYSEKKYPACYYLINGEKMRKLNDNPTIYDNDTHIFVRIHLSSSTKSLVFVTDKEGVEGFEIKTIKSII